MLLAAKREGLCALVPEVLRPKPLQRAESDVEERRVPSSPLPKMASPQSPTVNVAG